MVIRQEPDGYLLIGQPAHAFLAGQLARAWGREPFGDFEPREAVCLAADLHDIGWLEWEQQPEWNPRTGLPYDFMSTPRASHVRIWRRAARSLLSMNRYAALLTSLHGTGLYAGYDAQADPPEEADLVREFLRQEIAFQDTLIQLMEKDRFYRPFLEPRTLRRNRRLLAVWDLLSLHLCMGVAEPIEVPDVPLRDGATKLRVLPGDPVRFDPYPFWSDPLSVVLEGRWLEGPVESTEALRQALLEAPWRSRVVRLASATAGTPNQTEGTAQ